MLSSSLLTEWHEKWTWELDHVTFFRKDVCDSSMSTVEWLGIMCGVIRGRLHNTVHGTQQIHQTSKRSFFPPSSEQALLEYVSALRKQGKVERVEALTVALLQLWQLKFGNLLYVLETYTLQMSVSAALYSLLRAQVWTIRDSSLWK